MADPETIGLPASRKAALASGSMFFFTGRPCVNGHITRRYASINKCWGCSKAVQAQLRVETKIRQSMRILSPRQQALADGLSRYRTGIPCPRGHNVERLSSNGICVECGRENRIRCEGINPKRVEKRKNYIKSNAERYRCHVRNRRAKAKGNVGSHTKEDVSAIFAAQKGRCAYCRKKIKNWHVDHIQPISKGGTNARSNLQLTCGRCNLRKSFKDPVAFAQELGFLI